MHSTYSSPNQKNQSQYGNEVSFSQKCTFHYKLQARFSGDCDVQRPDLRIFLKGEAPSLLF